MALALSVKKTAGKFHLDLTLETASKRIGILGASGCGKSMTLKMIAGIEKPDEGFIRVNGRELFCTKSGINLKPQDRQVGYLFQNYALFPTMTVEQNIGICIKASKKEREEVIHRMASMFHLKEILKQYPGNISGGQQQRVAIARMLASKPQVLLFDEPFSALDSFLKEELYEQLKELLENYEGMSVIVTHDREEAYQFSDTLLLMDAGKIIQAGPTREVFAYPNSETALRIVGKKYLA